MTTRVSSPEDAPDEPHEIAEENDEADAAPSAEAAPEMQTEEAAVSEPVGAPGSNGKRQPPKPLHQSHTAPGWMRCVKQPAPRLRARDTTRLRR